MKVLLVNGSPHERGCTFTALSEVAKTLQENGVETEIFHVGNHPVRGCIACGRCAALGRCVFEDDAANQLQSLMKSADGVVIGSPVYYAGSQRRAVRSVGSGVLFQRRRLCQQTGGGGGQRPAQRHHGGV